MARKEVDLVIRAKNQAGKTVNSITTAIDKFVGATEDLSAAAKRTDTNIDGLGSALTGLEKSFKGFTGAAAIASSLDRAGAASDRLEKSVASLAAEAASLDKSLDQATASTDRFRAKSAGAVAAQEKMGAALKAGKADLREYGSALNKSNGERDRAVKAEKRLTGAISDQAAKVDRATARYRDLGTQLAGVAEPSKRLVTSFELSERALSKSVNRLATLRAEYAEAAGVIDRTSTEVAEFGTKTEAAASKVGKLETALGKIDANVKDLKASTREAGRNQKVLAEQADKAADALERERVALDRTGKEMRELDGSAKAAGVALSSTRRREHEGTGPVVHRRAPFDAGNEA